MPSSRRVGKRPARLEVEGDVHGLDEVVSFVEGECRARGVPAADRSSLRLVTEEVFVNIVTHGYEEGSGVVAIEVEDGDGWVRLRFTDRGRPFVPAEAPAPDLDSGWADRRIGGLGWHLVRASVDEIESRRDDGVNSIVLTKRIRRADPDGGGSSR